MARDISGDGVFVSQVHDHRGKPWVNQMIIPYTAPPSLPALARAYTHGVTVAL
jgi:hypothetical protein